MLDKDQADAASDALLSPAREAQEAVQKAVQERQEKRRRERALARHASIYGIACFIIGGLLGHIYFDSFIPAALGLMGLGVIIGRAIHRHVA
jgi:hypothetical protein